jgi:hypothetical protein
MGNGYWYLASPYSKYQAGIDAAWKDVCQQAGLVIQSGVPVYSPIAHTHPIAIYGNIDPYAHSIWLPADLPLMQNAKGLVVCKMQGWEESYGIEEEIKEFEKAGKPIVYMTPGEVPNVGLS